MVLLGNIDFVRFVNQVGGCITAHLLDTISSAHFQTDTIQPQTFNTDTDTVAGTVLQHSASVVVSFKTPT